MGRMGAPSAAVVQPAVRWAVAPTEATEPLEELVAPAVALAAVCSRARLACSEM